MDTEQAGSASCPVKTIEYALKRVNAGDIIYFQGDYKVTKNLSNGINKKVYFTGDSVDFSSLGSFEIRNDSEFTGNLTVKLPDNLIANGYSLKIDESVNVVPNTNGTTVFGGSSVNNVSGTDLTLLSGTYVAIYGGGVNGGIVTGDTKLTVAGNVNASAIYGGGKRAAVEGNTALYLGGNVNINLNISNRSEMNHSEAGKAMVYAGTFEGPVKGNTYVEINDNAKAGIIYGAGYGSSSYVEGKSTVIFNSGTAMGIYGGSSSGKCTSTAVVMNGGYVEQIFGGSNGAAITGNTDVRVLGGTVKRRVYGGCYNDYGLSGWKTSCTVTGNTNVVFDSNVSFPSDHSSSDNGLCSISRYNNNSAEVATLILSDYNGKLDSKIGSSYFNFSGGAYDYLLKVYPNVEAYSSNGTVYFKANKAGTLSIKCGNNTESTAVNVSQTVTRKLSDFNSKDITVTLN